MSKRNYRQYAVYLRYFQIIYNIAIKYLIAAFNVPSILNYVTDVVTIAILILSINGLRKENFFSKYKGISIIIVLLMANIVIGLLANGGNILLVLWAFRNTYRFFIFAICCMINLTKKDIQRMMTWFLYSLPVNVILCTIQYIHLQATTSVYVKTYAGDFVGGMFGQLQGSNAIMNLYLFSILAYGFSCYIFKKMNLLKLTLLCAMVFYIAILAEMKIVYVEFFIILILTMLLNRPTKKTVLIIISGFIMIPIIYYAWNYYNSESASILNLTNMIGYLGDQGYSGSHSVNRLNAIPKVYEIIFNKDGVSNLFGIGLGNGEHSIYSFMESQIYLYYNSLHYIYFSQSILYLETGLIGLLLYVSYFVANFITTCKYKLVAVNSDFDLIFLNFAQLFSVACIITIFYNSALRSEAGGYFAFLWISVPYIWYRNMEEIVEPMVKKRISFSYY